MVNKVCKICELTKPLSEFSVHNGTRDRLHRYCRACCAVKARAWKDANPLEAAAIKRRHRNVERDLAKLEAWRAANPLRLAAARAAYAQRRSLLKQAGKLPKGLPRAKEIEAARCRERRRVSVAVIDDWYARSLMVRKSRVLRYSDVPQPLVALVRELLLLKREIKRTSNEQRI